MSHTTISVPKELKRDMDERRNESESWPEYLRRIHRADPKVTVEVDTDEIVNQLLGELDDVIEVNVTIDGESGEINESDVRNIIENELEKRFEDLKRGRV